METKEFYINITPPTGDYNDVENKPSIDGVVLTSNTTLGDLGLDKVFTYKGQVATKNNLPKTNNTIGDTYDVEDTGINYAWNGKSWDEISRKDVIYVENGTLTHNNSVITIDSTKNTITGLKQSDINGLESAISSKANSSDLTSHTTNTNNPHSVTKAQVGLGNVDNTSDVNKPISTATQNALDGKVSDVKIDNKSVVSNMVVSLGTMATESASDYSTKTVADTLYADISYENTIDTHTSNTSNPHNVTKAQLGLENVDNTSDVNKPISTATQTALNLKEEKSTITTLSEVTTLVDNTIFRANEMATLELLLPTTYDADFVCEVDFTSGETATAFTMVDSVKWKGDDIVDGSLLPVSNKRYSIFIWYDGVFMKARSEGVEL